MNAKQAIQELDKMSTQPIPRGYQLANILKRLSEDTRDEKRAELLLEASYEVSRLVEENRKIQEELRKRDLCKPKF